MGQLEKLIAANAVRIHKVVDFDTSTDHLLPLDFTSSNTDLNDEILNDTDFFAKWVSNKLKDDQALYGIGGYNEHRTIYSRSAHFDTGEEPRRLHLGVDIWGPAGTPVYNFLEAKVHSFANNNRYGDYGATLILRHEIDGYVFHALYGHLNLASIQQIKIGDDIPAGEKIAEFGVQEENGFWPPHLHFQLIEDMQGKMGDYPGVCKFSERTMYLKNCPDPAIILNFSFPDGKF